MPATAKQKEMLERLREAYSGEGSALNFRNPYELLVATILAAQCTDARVNMITEEFFRRFPDAASLAAAETGEIEDYIKTCGLFRNKAKSLSLSARKIVSDYGGEVPHTMDKLLTLPGVGRKTASVVLAFGFGIPAIPVDTHVKRVSNRLGFAHSDDPEEVEMQLRKRIKKEDWIESHHWLIWHGRRVCKAQKPRCQECVLSDLCPAAKITDDSRQSKNTSKSG